MNAFLRKLGWWARRRNKEEELREELEFHVDEEADDWQARGFTREEAQRAGRRDLGNVALVQEDTRAVRGFTWLEQFAQDVRYAMHTMRANKLFTCLAVISLALGIGANTAIYSFLDAVLLRPLPVEDPDSLVVVNWQMPIPRRNSEGRPTATVVHSMDGSIYNDSDSLQRSGIFPYPAFELLQKHDTVFSNLIAFYTAGSFNLAIEGQAEIVDGSYVSGNYFDGLGLSPSAGRLILPDDSRPGAAPVVVVSHAFGQGRFGNIADAVGQRVLVNNVPFTIVGVAPQGFFGADASVDPELFLPLYSDLLLTGAVEAGYRDNNYYWLKMMGRLRPGVSLTAAQSALAGPFDQWIRTTAESAEERAHLPQLVLTEGASGPDGLRRRYSRQIYVLMILVGLILAVACANIANLLLARTGARRREFALRLSLGAGRLRVARQLLTESVVLSSLGGALGIFVAWWGIRFITLLLGRDPRGVLPRAELNAPVLIAALVLAVLTGLLFGLVPAIRLTRKSLMPTLKEVRSRRAPSRIPVTVSDLLVVSQVAMSLLMLVAAGLFVRTLSNLQSTDVGFNRENLLIFDVNARQAGYANQEMLSFYEDLYRRFSGIPGVSRVSFSNRELFTAGFNIGVSIAGQGVNTRMLCVSPEYFATMQIPILAGRRIDELETAGPGVAVVSELFAKANFGDENPLGRRLTIGGSPHAPGRDVEVVGVARDVRYGGFRGDLHRVVYIPYNQAPFYAVERMTFQLRTAGDPLSYVSTVRKIIGDVNPRVPLANLTTQAARIDQTISREIMFARVCTAFAILALTIACVGLYGTVAYNVARRTNEIGIRVALGAQRTRLILMILKKVMISVLVALVIGLPLALKASQYVESFLYSMEPKDPATIAASVLILLTATLLAAFIPANRASRIEPLVALRHE